jgi:hypothetical protein
LVIAADPVPDGQGAFVLEYASKIAAVDPSAAAGAFDEMFP